MRRALVLAPLLITLAGAWPAAASAEGWVCEASAVRAQMLDLAPVEPAVANRGAGDCKEAVGGGGFVPVPPIGQGDDRPLRLIASQTIDASDINIAKVAATPGVDLGALQIALQPILDALPNIRVPATLARIRLVPNERIVSGTRLTQRALHATITIAGTRLADVVVGEATVGVGDVSCGGVADLALQCTLRRLVLIDVYEQGDRVKLLGAADRRYVGRRVQIRFTATGGPSRYRSSAATARSAPPHRCPTRRSGPPTGRATWRRSASSAR